MSTMRPTGDFRTSYQADMTIFPTRASRLVCWAAVAALCACPWALDGYMLNLMIQIAYLGIAALGLNILVGFTGQISLGHSAFFGFGAFSSAWVSNELGVPVFFAIPIAGLMTTAVGMIFGIPAARIRGLYLLMATLASQFILQDFFARAEWFTGGAAGALAEPFSILGFAFDGDRSFFYVALVYLVVMYVAASNLMRTRDGRAFVAVRDHYLSAEIMGVNLTKYRILSFGISSFYAGVGGALFAHYLGFVSVEGFDIFQSVQFLGMIIIGGLGSVMGSLMGTAFMVLLPEVMEGAVGFLRNTPWGELPAFSTGLPYLKEMAIGVAIVLFLIFEPDGLAHRWRQTKAYFKLYPFSY